MWEVMFLKILFKVVCVVCVCVYTLSNDTDVFLTIGSNGKCRPVPLMTTTSTAEQCQCSYSDNSDTVTSGFFWTTRQQRILRKWRVNEGRVPDVLFLLYSRASETRPL